MSKVLDEIMAVRADRVDAYGSAEDSFSFIGDLWSVYVKYKRHHCSDSDSAGAYVFSPEDVGVMMTLLKIARTVGGADKLDNYVDGANYMALAGDMKFNEESS